MVVLLLLLLLLLLLAGSTVLILAAAVVFLLLLLSLLLLQLPQLVLLLLLLLLLLCLLYGPAIAPSPTVLHVVQISVRDMFGTGDDSNVVLSDQATVVFNVSNVNDEQPVFQEIQEQVGGWVGGSVGVPTNPTNIAGVNLVDGLL